MERFVKRINKSQEAPEIEQFKYGFEEQLRLDDPDPLENTKKRSIRNLNQINKEKIPESSVIDIDVVPDEDNMDALYEKYSGILRQYESEKEELE